MLADEAGQTQVFFAMGAAAIDMGLAVAEAIEDPLEKVSYRGKKHKKTAVFTLPLRFVLGEKAKEIKDNEKQLKNTHIGPPYKKVNKRNKDRQPQKAAAEGIGPVMGHKKARKAHSKGRFFFFHLLYFAVRPPVLRLTLVGGWVIGGIIRELEGDERASAHQKGKKHQGQEKAEE